MGGLINGSGGSHGDGGGDDGEDIKGGVEVMAFGETLGMTWWWWKWQQREEPQRTLCDPSLPLEILDHHLLPPGPCLLHSQVDRF